jgi:hypothetical protein
MTMATCKLYHLSLSYSVCRFLVWVDTSATYFAQLLIHSAEGSVACEGVLQ